MSTARPASTRVRRTVAWVVPAVLLPSLAVVGIAASRPARSGDAVARYAPLVPGTTSVFTTTTNGSPSGLDVQQVTGPALLVVDGSPANASVVESRYENFLGQGPGTIVQYVGPDGDRLLEYGIRFDGILPDAGSYYPDAPAIPVLDLPLVEGATWSWEGTSLGRPRTLTITVVGIEDLRVAGHRFGDCVHLRGDLVEQDASAATVTDEWRCPSVGLVRVRSDGTAVGGSLLEEELVEFHGPGLDLRTEGAGLPASGLATGAVEPGAVPAVDPGRSGAVADVELRVDRLAWSLVRNGPTISSPVGAGGALFLGENDGTVSATDTDSGQVLWQVSLTEPLAASPVAAGGLVLTADGAKRLWALDAGTGAARWVVVFPDQVASPPVIAEGRAVLAVEDGTLRALSLTDGAPAWSVGLDDLVTTPPVLAGDLVVVAGRAGGVHAYHAADGTPAWQADLEGSLSAGPVAGGGLVVVSDTGGRVDAFDAASGELRWRRSPPAIVDVAPVVAGDSVVIAAGDVIESADRESGSTRWRAALRRPLLVPPMVLGQTVAVLYEDDRLERIDLEDGRSLGILVLHGPDRQSETSTDHPLGFANNALIVPMEVLGPTSGGGWPQTWLYAFPAEAPGASDESVGARLAGGMRPVPSTPVYPPSLVGDEILAATGDGAFALPPRGSPRPLVESPGNVRFAVPAGDLVLAQNGTDLVAVPLVGGPPAWTHPMRPALNQTAPAVAGDLVVAPTELGLVGLDADTGRERWSVPLSQGQGSTAPLPLPDGGVGYAVGEVTTVEAASGSVRWSIPGVDTYGPIGYADGAVVVSAYTSDAAGAVGIDAQSGSVLWGLNGFPMSLIGIGAGEGVALATDALGTVRALAPRSGEVQWSLHVRSPLSSTPVIVDGRAVIPEAGRPENVLQHDNRITIVDAATGRFVTSMQFTGFTQVPGGLGATGSTLLVPASGVGTGLGTVVMDLRLEGP